MSNYIRLQNVNLHYSSAAYRETSLKAFVFKAIGRRGFKPLQDVHALKDVSFEMKPGDRVALIGHNGAGKSTLLRTIAQLYPISSGMRDVRGEIRALFELTLGFESEATGRENIYYRGLLLGETPKTIKKLVNEIIEFADIGDFIEYPIKTYSAGMLVRLAFAISTAVPGDILLLDEVVGAGDASFAEKAKNRIASLIKNSEILVFASHDFASIKALCNRALVLDHGRILCDGDVDLAINYYKQMISTEAAA